MYALYLSSTPREQGEHQTAVLAEIEEIGEITSRDISGDDVTQEYYDVQARLDQYKACLLYTSQRYGLNP